MALSLTIPSNLTKEDLTRYPFPSPSLYDLINAQAGIYYCGACDVMVRIGKETVAPSVAPWRTDVFRWR